MEESVWELLCYADRPEHIEWSHVASVSDLPHRPPSWQTPASSSYSTSTGVVRKKSAEIT